MQPAFSPGKVSPSEPPIEDSQTVVPSSTVVSDRGPYPVTGDIERPQRLGGHRTIDGLITMMRSGEYSWGVCIFQLTITEEGDVTDIEFLQPEDLAAEVQDVIVEAARQWKFSPATRAGEPVPVIYNLLIHHCPFHRKNRTVE